VSRVVELHGVEHIISQSLCSVLRRIFGGRSRRLGVDSADTSAISDTDLDVTFFSPTRTPGVLDEEVIVAVFGTVTNGEDTVVELGSAAFGGDDTLLVSLEDGFVGLNSDRDGLLVKSGLELIGRVGGDIVEILDIPCKGIILQSQVG
jgi:hypothetical protein